MKLFSRLKKYIKKMKDIESKDVCDKIKSIHKEIKKRIDFSEKDGLLLKYIRAFQGIFIDISVFTFFVFLFFVVISVSASIVESEKLGQIGDSFGLITSLFTVLAFIGVLLTLKEQREQFELQIDEQGKQFKLQNFESTFFNLLNLHNDILQDMNIDEKNEKRKCFFVFHEKFQLKYDKEYPDRKKLKLEYLQNSQNKPMSSEERDREANLKAMKDMNNIQDEDKIKYILKAYEWLQKEYNNELGHYYRNLYQIFNYIRESDIDNKMKYAKIVRAQFSKYEIFILYYNCFFYETFKEFVESYGLLKGIRDYPEWKSKVRKISSDTCYYEESSFG